MNSSVVSLPSVLPEYICSGSGIIIGKNALDKLEDLLIRFEEIMGELNEPTVTNNQERFRKLMKEQSDLTPIVEAYKEYKKCKVDIEDSLVMLYSYLCICSI